MSEFKREDRYIVIKRSDMETLPADTRRNFQGRCRSFYEQMLIAGAPARSFLVIESDWPEYEPAWQMIERRMTGQPSVTAAEELEAVLFWRDKHAVANRARDALQQRLTAADDKNDTLTTAYLSAGVREHLLRLRVDVLEGLLREVVLLDPRGEFLGWQLDGKIDAALKPAEGGGSTCNQIREESGLPINRPCKACGVGACIDR